VFPLGVGDLNALGKENGDAVSIPERPPGRSLSPGEYPWALERPLSISEESRRGGERIFRVVALLVSGLMEEEEEEGVAVVGLWRTSVRLEMLPFRLCPLPCLTCVGRDDVEVADCCCECCDCHIRVEEGVLGLEEVEGGPFGYAIIDWKLVLDRGEAGLLFDELRSESNGSEPCRSSVGVYRPFKLLERNPPERGVAVRDGCFAVEALESRRAKEELVTFIALL